MYWALGLQHVFGGNTIQQGSGWKVIILLTPREIALSEVAHPFVWLKTGHISVPVEDDAFKSSFLSLWALKTQVFGLGAALTTHYQLLWFLWGDNYTVLFTQTQKEYATVQAGYLHDLLGPPICLMASGLSFLIFQFSTAFDRLFPVVESFWLQPYWSL